MASSTGTTSTTELIQQAESVVAQDPKKAEELYKQVLAVSKRMFSLLSLRDGMKELIYVWT